VEASFVENQKHQRAAKPVCSVNTNTVKNASSTLNDVVAIGNPERHMRKASHRGSKQQ